jgi:hypothetical protein
LVEKLVTWIDQNPFWDISQKTQFGRVANQMRQQQTAAQINYLNCIF